jgi:hypothetical protein
MSLNDGPPKPIPPHLWPQRGDLGPGDVVSAASTAEYRVVFALLEHERLAGSMLFTVRDGSPWLEIAVNVPDMAEARDYVRPELGGRELRAPGTYHFALWRYNGQVHRVGRDGAVEDDPIALC